MTLPFLICVIGLMLWLLFTKVQSIADGFAAELGRLMFFAGLLAYLFAVGSKTVF